MKTGKSFKDWHFVRHNEPINEVGLALGALGLGLGAAGKWAYDKWKASRPQAQYQKNAQAQDFRRYPVGDPRKDQWAMPHSWEEIEAKYNSPPTHDWDMLIGRYAQNLGISPAALAQPAVNNSMKIVAAAAIWGRQFTTVDAPDLENIWRAMTSNKNTRKLKIQDPRIIITSVPVPNNLSVSIRNKVPITQAAQQWFMEVLERNKNRNTTNQQNTNQGNAPMPGNGPGGTPGGSPGSMNKQQKIRTIKNYYLDAMSRISSVLNDAKVQAADVNIKSTFPVGGTPGSMFPDWNPTIIADIPMQFHNVGKLMKHIKKLPTAPKVFSKMDKASVLQDLEDARNKLNQVMSVAGP